MKYLFFNALMCFWSISYSQMTYSELVKITKMNSDEFELYAIDKGYHFDSFLDEDNREGVVYSKGNDNSYKRITFYYTNKFFETIKEIYYLTTSTREVLNFKKNILNNGFSLVESKVDKDDNSKFEEFIYFGKPDIKNKMVKLFTDPPNDEFPYVQYQIKYWAN